MSLRDLQKQLHSMNILTKQYEKDPTNTKELYLLSLELLSDYLLIKQELTKIQLRLEIQTDETLQLEKENRNLKQTLAECQTRSIRPLPDLPMKQQAVPLNLPTSTCNKDLPPLKKTVKIREGTPQPTQTPRDPPLAPRPV